MRCCSVCGKALEDQEVICSGCGTLVELNAEVPAPAVSDETVQTGMTEPQAIETPVMVPTPPVKTKSKMGIIIAVIAVAVVLIVGAVVGLIVYNNYKAEEARLAEERLAEESRMAEESRQAEEKAAYEDNLSHIYYAIISGAADAESAGNLTKKVWYNAIYEKRDSETDLYTRPNGYFVDDFNEALGNLFADSSYRSKISDIKDNQESVKKYMKALMNPPEGYQETFDAVKECYDAYMTFTGLVVSPTGSLQTFSENFNAADADVLNKWEALQLYLDD